MIIKQSIFPVQFWKNTSNLSQVIELWRILDEFFIVKMIMDACDGSLPDQVEVRNYLG
tara:strand:+ start:107 stop:280 length:174 start_codon:yes stop_codon:yes gene_type:complete